MRTNKQTKNKKSDVQDSPILDNEPNKKDFIDLGMIHARLDNILMTQACENQQAQQKVNKSININLLYDDVIYPSYATEGSACFDLHAYLGYNVSSVKVFNRLLNEYDRKVTILIETGKRGIYIEPYETMLIPTGLIFDIPLDYKINIYPRSGLSIKKHITLVNSPGIVDSDYVNQVFIGLINLSDIKQSICHNDRIAQGELLPFVKISFNHIKEEIKVKTSRIGGFGHTG